MKSFTLKLNAANYLLIQRIDYFTGLNRCIQHVYVIPHTRKQSETQEQSAF